MASSWPALKSSMRAMNMEPILTPTLSLKERVRTELAL